jgi:hypothetical protein
MVLTGADARTGKSAGVLESIKALLTKKRPLCSLKLDYSALSVGILFSTGMMSKGVLDLIQIFCSLKNLAGITSQASPIVSTGMRMPLGVVLNSCAEL